MSHLEVPLLGKRVWATGDLLLRAELDLLVRDDSGLLRPETFRVDSGSEMTSMAAARAKALDLPMPRNPIFVDINGIIREVRPGLIRSTPLQIVSMIFLRTSAEGRSTSSGSRASGVVVMFCTVTKSRRWAST